MEVARDLHDPLSKFNRWAVGKSQRKITNYLSSSCFICFGNVSGNQEQVVGQRWIECEFGDGEFLIRRSIALDVQLSRQADTARLKLPQRKVGARFDFTPDAPE